MMLAWKTVSWNSSEDLVEFNWKSLDFERAKLGEQRKTLTGEAFTHQDAEEQIKETWKVLQL